MNGNNLEINALGIRVLNRSKSFQDRRIKSFKNKNVSINYKSDVRNNNSKNPSECHNENTMNINGLVKLDSFTQKCYNDKARSNFRYGAIDWKHLLKSSSNGHSDSVSTELKNISESKESLNLSSDLQKSRDHKNQYKSTLATLHLKDRPAICKRFNFLQESQLDGGILDAISDSSKSRSTVTSGSLSSSKSSHNSHNDTSVELTPPCTGTAPPSSPSSSRTDLPDKELKSLSLGLQNAASFNLNCSNDHVTLQSTNQGNIGKLCPFEPEFFVQNGYNCRSADWLISRPSFTSPVQIIPLYGARPPLIHYNPVQAQTGFLVYSPVVINGIYNQYMPPPLLPINRLVSSNHVINTIRHNIPHPFYHN